MAATFKVYLDTNTGPIVKTDTDVLSPVNVRFKTNDNPTIDSVDPIPIPGTGTNYSYWKHVYLKCTGAPTTQVNNIRFYTDGTSFGTGITLSVGLQFPTNTKLLETGYVQATGTPGETGLEMTANHTGITTKADAFGYTETTPPPLSGPTISEDGGIINAVDEESDYLVLQMEVISTAAPGDLANEQLTFKYDEI